MKIKNEQQNLEKKNEYAIDKKFLKNIGYT